MNVKLLIMVCAVGFLSYTGDIYAAGSKASVNVGGHLRIIDSIAKTSIAGNKLKISGSPSSLVGIELDDVDKSNITLNSKGNGNVYITASVERQQTGIRNITVIYN